MKRLTFAFLFLLAVGGVAGYALYAADTAEMPAVFVAYPREGDAYAGLTRVYCTGAVADPSVPVCVNGVSVPVYRTGAFSAMVGARPGVNSIYVTWGTNTLVRKFTVVSGEPEKRSAPGAKIVAPATTHDPYADLGLSRNVAFPPSPPAGKRPSEILIMVDPGHGGSDTGALTPHGLPEKDANLLQAREIARALQRAGYRVVMTRNDDTFLPLYDRPKWACRMKADAFISVHHNATAPQTDPRAIRHTVTYASNVKGLPLASAIQRHIAHEMAPVRDLGGQIKSLAVCRNPAVASCLLEVDFINLPEGEETAWDPGHRQRVAEAVVRGVKEWAAGR